MNNRSSVLSFLPCIDSPDMASAREQELNIRRAKEFKLGKSAVGAAQRGYYINSADAKSRLESSGRECSIQED